MTRLIKKIHQIWDKEEYPIKYIKHRSSLLDKHSDWEYKLWNLNECRDLIKLKYNYFLNIFDNFKYNIQKIDAARFFILDYEGGFYTDVDIYFYKNVEDLFNTKKAIVFNENSNQYICNSVMYNNNSLFFKKICKQLKYFHLLFFDKNKNDVINVLNLNGQNFLTNFFKLNNYDCSLLESKYFEFYKSQENYKNEDFIYGIHEYANIWFEKDKVLV
jgi:hypothetical protein